MSKAHAFSFGPLVWFTGVVEDRVGDPKKAGRVKVRIYGYHSASTSDIPTNDLMWAIVAGPTTTANLSGLGETPSGLVEGVTVVGWFLDGEDAQTPLIIGTLPGTPNAAQSGKGFNDPSGQYPNYNDGESDINRLARGETTGVDMVTTKKSNLVKNVATAGGQKSGPKWSQPKSPAGPKYPYNHVRMTESGHIEEFDDTKGKERINRYHKSGTYLEIGPDGTQVTQIVKDNYTLISGDDFVQIRGKCSINVEGDTRISVGGDAYLNIAGDMDQVISGDYNLTVDGDLNLKVSGDYNNTASGQNTTKASAIFLN
jgi:hypothetical protein